ncbi:lipid-A-disaccharide synthase [Photobacterium sanguinicancri]|uniref:lipid-A-disaccharide synthase n=1 Tax=Photobacterium sanguinicancri TaxID=875932 RepID=UPI0007868515|nr:lipid-A-disaccharide synthase [Photobacterium sanguinicancri]KXI22899.1 lipid-A-disaccharide synthase [Photobacterium sanguinicancri]
MAKPLRIGIVAGEISGDILGAGFIKAVKAQYPDAEFVGVAGPRMIEAGCEALFDMEELAVMGIVEVFGRLPRLFKIKAELVKYFSDNPPDVFVGIDAPDFNLRLERDLKESGIKTVHYVSPSVWAWRQKRIFKIEAATNLVLAFLPFEKAFYDKFNVPCEFVGHTMADAIPLQTDQLVARELLGLDNSKRWLAVLPGSRGGEMSMIAAPFIETCQRLHQQHPDLGFVVALVNEQRRQQFEQAWRETAPELNFVLVDDTARNVMIASDAVLLASGTVSLECMLVKRPMVVGYIVKPLTAWIARRMLKTKYVSLPNILADKELVPELLQENCTPEKLTEQVNHYLSTDNSELMAEFNQLHQRIRCNADQKAAQAVLNLIGKTTDQQAD